MISTSFSSTSDYCSGSDPDYDDDHVVKAAPQHHHHPSKQTNIILKTLLRHHHHSSSHLSSSIRLQQSLTLLKIAKENGLSDEIFIKANAILHKFLLSTSLTDLDQSIVLACLSLATKLTQHSSHFAITILNTNALPMSEDMICNALEWDIDMTTPINYIEALLLFVDDCTKRDHVRRLSSEMVVLCLTDERCMDMCVASMGMCCVLMACEMVDCDEIIREEVYKCVDNGEDGICECSLMYIRQILMNILRR